MALPLCSSRSFLTGQILNASQDLLSSIANHSGGRKRVGCIAKLSHFRKEAIADSHRQARQLILH
jgi:hypothetical protein